MRFYWLPDYDEIHFDRKADLPELPGHFYTHMLMLENKLSTWGNHFHKHKTNGKKKRCNSAENYTNTHI